MKFFSSKISGCMVSLCVPAESYSYQVLAHTWSYFFFSLLLAEGDLSDVCREVVGIESRYYQFGIALGLLSGQLDSIRTAYHQLIDQAFYQVLLLWLRQSYDYQRHGRPTWRRLVEAVDSPSGGKNTALAMVIASRHPVSGTDNVLSLSLPSLHIEIVASFQSVVLQ